MQDYEELVRVCQKQREELAQLKSQNIRMQLERQQIVQAFSAPNGYSMPMRGGFDHNNGDGDDHMIQ